MISTEPLVSVSFSCWSKLKSLSADKTNQFIAYFSNLIFSIIDQKKLVNSLSHKSLIFICNRNIAIVIVVYLSERQEQIVKIIDYIHTRQKQSIINAVKNEQHIYVEIREINLEDIEIKAWDNFEAFINWNYQFKLQHFNHEEDDFWCYQPDREQTNQYDFLSSQQFAVLHYHQQLPIILTGDRSTGKTKTAIYSALNYDQQIETSSSEKILYVTEKKASAQQAKRSYELYHHYQNIDFLSYLKLSKNIIEKYPLICTQKFLSQREINFYKFKEKFFKPRKIFVIKAEELWREIRQIIKGSSKAIRKNQSMITLTDYLSVQAQSSLPQNVSFKLIYDIALQYQDWLESQKYWDELDLTRYLLKQLPNNYLGEYEAIYLDGIDNFTETQINLVFKLLKTKASDDYLPQLFLINNSESSSLQNNYTWNRVKKLIIDSFHKLPQWTKIRNLMEPNEFTHSFTCVDTITQLKSSVASLIGQNLSPYSWLSSPHKPLVVSEISEQFLRSQSSLNFDCGVLVFNEAEKNKLAAIFPQDNQRIIDFAQLDNLDFEHILVWRLFSYCYEQQTKLQLSEQQTDQLKCNLVTECTKRVQKSIYFYDETIDTFWNISSINNLVEIGYETELEPLFGKEYSEEQVNAIAEQYLVKGTQQAYQITEQIFDRVADVEGQDKVLALLEENKGNYGKAADIWNRLGVFDEAINCWNEVDPKLWLAKWSVLNEYEWQKRGNYFEDHKDYQKAKFCYEKANDFEGKLKCLEQDNQWELAGDECQQRNLNEQAEQYYYLADQYYRQNEQSSLAIKMWSKLNKWNQVALIWEESEQWEKAGNCWQKHGDMQKAAQCWQKAEKWAEAQKCWQQLGNWQELALSYEYQEDWQLAAQTWLKVEQKEKAGLCFEKAHRWQEAGDIWSQLGYWGFVAICLQQQEKWAEAAEAWSKTNPSELQALCYEKSGDWANAEKCWFKTNNWHRIILACEQQGKWQEAAESWENLGEWLNAGFAWQKINETEKAALCYEAGEYWQKAESCWRQLERSDRIAVTLEKQELWSAAATIWQKLGEWEKAGWAWENEGQIEKAALSYEQSGNWRAAEKCWWQLKNWSKVANACNQQGEWQKAAYDWIQANQLDKAALCYENCEDWERAAHYWLQCSNWEKFAHACEQIEEWENAASAYLKIDNLEKAGFCFEKAQDWSKAEDCWRKLYKWDRLAIACEVQRNWLEAGKSWLIVNEIEKAALCYQKAEDWAKAEECWRQLNNWENIAIACEQQNKWEEAAQLWQYLEEWEKAAEACLKMNDLQTAIKYYEKGGYIHKAQQYKEKLYS